MPYATRIGPDSCAAVLNPISTAASRSARTCGRMSEPKLTDAQLALLRKLFRGFGIAAHGRRRAAEARTLGRLIDKGLVESIGVGAWLPSATACRLLDEAHQRDRVLRHIADQLVLDLFAPVD